MNVVKGLNGSTESLKGVDSDYGSDLDDDTWDSILAQAESNPLAEISIEPLQDVDLGENDQSSRLLSLRLPSSQGSLPRTSTQRDRQIPLPDETTPSQISNHRPKSRPQSPLRTDDGNGTESPNVIEHDDNDSRTPLERFRTPPKKTLSVTDFVSPAWCELQYWYSLTRYGRIRRTPAMKVGTKIHKEKEREVYIEVPIETHTREDRMGLRLWNIIQGLRTLRLNGMTRELQVFGLVDGEVVIGIIDEITSMCPDEETEATILGREQAVGGAATKKKKKDQAVATDQRSMKEYFQASPGQRAHQDSGDVALTSFTERSPTYYLVDIKTRGAKSLPPQRQMKPTTIQLMMYRQMLSELAANHVEANLVFQRYRLDQDVPFTDAFTAELASLDTGSSDAESDEGPAADSLDEILSHNTLSSLWTLMIQEFGKALPVLKDPSTISPLLTAEYRSSKEGNLIGRKSFAFNSDELNAHTSKTLEWWRGERPARGVEIEDAWKCGICEFAESCSWRADKIEEATQKARTRTQSRTHTPT